MKPAKHYYFVFLVLIALSLAACTRNLTGFNGNSGGGGGNGGGGTGGGGGGNNNGTTFTIGGKVVGLLGSGMVLEDNGGDDLTVPGNGSFTFKTAVNGAYAVTVKKQPTSPVQLCTVANGSGNATANVTTVVVNCGGGGFTIGGAVSGLIGSGLVLQDNGGDNFTVTGYGNVPFTFASSLNPGAAYAVTVLTQPVNPAQVCGVNNGTGTANSNIANVQVICTQPGFTIGGSVVGLVVGTGDTLELQNNGGDNLLVTGDTPWKFPTPVTNGGIYNVSTFLPPNSQPQPCNEFYYTGVATANVNSVIVDCQHNDWGWTSWFIPNTNSANNYSSITTPLVPNGGAFLSDLGTPGGRDFASAWTDKLGRKWLFGGFGFPYPAPIGKQLPGFLNDLWVFDPGIGWIPANLRIYFDLAGNALVDPLTLEFEDVSTGSGPGSRWGSSSWTDSSGNLWLFGGQGFDSTSALDPALLNDLWKCAPANGLDNGPFPAGPVGGTILCPWSFAGGSTVGNQKGVYTGTMSPGGRWAAATASDAAGNLYLFGGQGLDSNGTTGLLNDLWKFNGSTWTWLGPSNSNIVNQNSTTTAPGSRQAGVLWVDSAGNIWLFGGFGLDSKGTVGSIAPPNPKLASQGAILNDLWEFNIGTSQWTQVSGSTTANQTGTYGTQATDNTFTQPGGVVAMPGSRWGAVGWRDSANNLWFYGGWGYGSTATNPTGFLNDIWEYHVNVTAPKTPEWIWWKGTSNVNQNSNFAATAFPGADGVLFVNNVVGGRRGAVVWRPDLFGYLMVFGGEGYDASQGAPPGYLDDLWTYLPFPN